MFTELLLQLDLWCPTYLKASATLLPILATNGLLLVCDWTEGVPGVTFLSCGVWDGCTVLTETWAYSWVRGLDLVRTPPIVWRLGYGAVTTYEHSKSGWCLAGRVVLPLGWAWWRNCGRQFSMAYLAWLGLVEIGLGVATGGIPAHPWICICVLSNLFAMSTLRRALRNDLHSEE